MRIEQKMQLASTRQLYDWAMACLQVISSRHSAREREWWDV